MTLRGSSGQACASCKFQRRRCTPQCLLAPFFPADQPQVFHNVHRLFGVKNIQKLLKELHPDQRAIAIKSVKFHAAMRERYPVCGCLVEVQNLAYQIQLAEKELHAVLQQLLYYRQQQRQQQDTSPGDDYLSQLQLGMAPPGNTAMVAALIQQDDQPEYNLVAAHPSSCSNNVNRDHYNKDCNDVDSLCSYSNNDYNNNANSAVMQSQMPTSQTIPQVPQDYNEMYSFFDNIDDRQSYIGPKEVYESSLDSSVRDCRQSDEQIAENELKNAAACFSLTSFN
ncbi:LOB domain-containing protein 27-like [Salvia miltiorrhiza]|uniref:LOB domain-containing protein 27-like n=1 Tax=Salvia miltiorrhiza TaxID=226208 RepID=UPI0025AD739A|nr:LOB domain-containing protein 27-like [Salvia miltiorrhiza]